MRPEVVGRVLWISLAAVLVLIISCNDGPTVALDADVPGEPCDSSCPPPVHDTVFDTTPGDTVYRDTGSMRVDTVPLICRLYDENRGDVPWYLCEDGYIGPLPF